MVSHNSQNAIHLHSFKGGIILKHHKNVSLQNGLHRLPIPEKLVVSLRLNNGTVAMPVVAIGDYVLKGQLIAQPHDKGGSFIHAPASGTVTDIKKTTTASPNADISKTIEICTDKKNQWIERHHTNIIEFIEHAKTSEIVDAIYEGGLIGLGGAGFPTHLKYHNSNNNDQQPTHIHTLIINGAECEPYITCDEQLMIEYAEDLINGGLLMMKASGADHVLFAIEDQVGGIKSHLQSIIKQRKLAQIDVIKVPTIYPAGGEKQLIKVLTGLEVPSGGLPLDLGIIVQNVATIKALNDYITEGKPLVERIVTVAGDAVNKPQNLIVPIGTPIGDVLRHAGCDFNSIDRIVIGGPMMGYAMPDAEIGIDKTSNCLLALTQENTKQHGPTLPCIRCGECVNVCPAELLPQQLHWYIKGGNLEKAREHHVFDCIECGACAWVCPSQIKLVDYYRYAKSELKYLDFKRQKADAAQSRHEKREQRLLKLKQQRAEKRQKTLKRTADPDKMKKDLQAIMARAQAAKASKNTNENSIDNKQGKHE